MADGKRCTTIYIHHSNIFLLVFHGPSLSSSASSSSHFTTQLLIDVCQLSTTVAMIPPPFSISPSFYPHYFVDRTLACRRQRASSVGGAPTENQPAKTKMPITKGSRDNFYLLVCFRGRNSNSICHPKYTISKSRPKDRFD
jgi:hypothetical protein